MFDAGVALAVCPYANRFFGIEPNIQGAMEAGMDIMLGTDNAMLNPPSMCKEVRYLMDAGMSVTDAINSAVAIPRKVLNGSESIPLDIGGAADIVVFEAPDLSERGLMNALDEKNISLCVIDGKEVTTGKDGGM